MTIAYVAFLIVSTIALAYSWYRVGYHRGRISVHEKNLLVINKNLGVLAQIREWAKENGYKVDE